MTLKEREKISYYLYHNSTNKEFVFNEFYEELSKIIIQNDCISDENQNDIMRQENINKIKNTINIFLSNHSLYKNLLYEFYNIERQEQLELLFDNLIMGYVFYLSMTIDKFKDINILRSKKSVCCVNETLYNIIINDNYQL